MQIKRPDLVAVCHRCATLAGIEIRMHEALTQQMSVGIEEENLVALDNFKILCS